MEKYVTYFVCYVHLERLYEDKDFKEFGFFLHNTLKINLAKEMYHLIER